MLSPDFTDINECEENSGTNAACEHVCVNTNGSYFCECNSGYRLARNGKRCNGNYDYV